MKCLLVSLLAMLFAMPLNVLANSGNSIFWNEVIIHAQNGITVQASVDNEGKLKTLSIHGKDGDYAIPKSVFCTGTYFDLRSIDVYETFGEIGLQQRYINLSLNEVGADPAGRVLQYQFHFSQTALVSYSILSLGDDGTVRVIEPSADFALTCEDLKK